MPNIELHGFFWMFLTTGSAQDLAEANREVDDKSKKIWEALRGATYFDEVVVTKVLSASESCKDTADPFLRIWATSQDEVDNIVKRLEPLDIDMEVGSLLAQWIERRSVRLKKQEAAQATLRTLRPVTGTDPDFDYGRDAEGYGKHESMK